jgi:H+/Cl- antiporter ClcA
MPPPSDVANFPLELTFFIFEVMNTQQFVLDIFIAWA